MKSVMNKIFSSETDESVHNEFVKFSKGLFQDRYLVDAKKQKDKWNIKTSNEYTNFLVRSCLEKVKEVDVTGVIVATFDVSKEAEFPVEKIKQFMGIKQAVINSKIESEKILKLMDKYPKAFFALSFKGNDFELKIKAKAPKSAKPAATGEKEPKAEFCSIKTSDRAIVSDILFDCLNETDLSIKHQIVIEDIVLPKNEKDPVKIRENAIRKGKVIRILTVRSGESNKQTKKEINFAA